MKPARHRLRKAARRRAHALRLDNRKVYAGLEFLVQAEAAHRTWTAPPEDSLAGLRASLVEGKA